MIWPQPGLPCVVRPVYDWHRMDHRMHPNCSTEQPAALSAYARGAMGFCWGLAVIIPLTFPTIAYAQDASGQPPPAAQSIPATRANSPPEPAITPSLEAASFAAAFEGAVEPLAAQLVDIDPLMPVDAVDLDSFEPPRGARVIRSLGLGIASYYGRRFHGRLTANGERFDMNAMTAAHKTLPFGTYVRVINPVNDRTVTVRINDRGPFIQGREIDLSRGAAERIGMIQSGHARVQLDIVAP